MHEDGTPCEGELRIASEARKALEVTEEREAVPMRGMAAVPGIGLSTDDRLDAARGTSRRSRKLPTAVMIPE